MKSPETTQLLLRREMKHTTSYLRMKAEDVRNFLATIVTIAIAAIPTWRTQHEAYIRARLKLITGLEEETILAALIADHNTRHATRIVTYHDPRYFLMFEIDDDPVDAQAPTLATSATPTRAQPRATNGRFARSGARRRSGSDPRTFVRDHVNVSLGCIKRTDRPQDRIAKFPKRAHKIGIDLLPMSVPSRESNFTLLLVAVDYYTHRIFIEPMRTKDDTLESFKSLRQRILSDVEEHELVVTHLRGDADSMFFDKKFQRYCRSVNTTFSSAGPGDQFQSGRV